MIFTLGTLTFGGTVLFETATETCVLVTGGWCTIRIPRLTPAAAPSILPAQ